MAEKDCVYEVKTKDKIGRILVCKKDLKRGEEVLSELPVAVGPKQDTMPLCLGCLAPVDASTLCDACGWPVCEPACAQLPRHRDAECPIFAKAKARFQPPSSTEEAPSGDCPQYGCITVLRLLLAKEKDPERWAKEVEPMKDHLKERKASDRWPLEETNVVKYLRDHCKLADRFSEDLVGRVIGILGVNGFEVRSHSGSAVVALYPKTAIMSHNCVANTAHSVAPDKDYRIIVRAAVDMKKGDELFSSYTSSLLPTMLRRENLSVTKFFECDCARCADPTELGTNASSLKCTKCDPGVIRSTAPLDPAADWRCSHCENNFRGEQIRRIYAVMQNETEAAEAEGLEALERLLKQYRSVVHPKHALIIAIKHSLAHLYGRVDGYLLDDLPDILLERKAELCREVLAMVDVIEPGCTRLRGLLLYELHVPLIIHARSSYQQGILTESQLREKLQAAADILREGKDILILEDEGTPEGAVGRVAEQSLQQLLASIETLPK